MSTVILTRSFDPRAFADAALRRAAVLWFVVAVLGQWAFAYYVAAAYGPPAARGDLKAWNESLFRGYIPGDTIGNVAVAMHLLLAVFILIGGPLQFSSTIRRHAPTFHRWNGRLYMLGVTAATMSGVYMIWVRKTLGNNVQHAAQTLNAILVLTFAVLALRNAVARDFSAHRRWALRLFLVGNGVWFMRVGFQLWRLITDGRPVGFDFSTVWTFGAYLLPLAILEIYLWTVKRADARGRLTMATALLVLTIAMGIGIIRVVTLMWLPRV